MQNDKSGPGGRSPMGGRPPAMSLADSQRTMVKAILAKYDVANLSKEDAKAIVKALEEAGIWGPAVADVFSEAGIHPERFMRLAFGDRPMGPRPTMAGRPPEEPPLTDERKAALTAILAKYDLGSLTAEDAKAILKALEDSGLGLYGVMEAMKERGVDLERITGLAFGARQPLARASGQQ